MMNIVKSMYISLAVALIILGVPSSLAFASIVDYDNKPEIQEECEERSDCIRGPVYESVVLSSDK
jgi:hypothetical protein